MFPPKWKAELTGTDDEENLRKHAARGAAAHARAAKEKAAQFDQQRVQKAANGDVDLKGVDCEHNLP